MSESLTSLMELPISNRFLEDMQKNAGKPKVRCKSCEGKGCNGVEESEVSEVRRDWF